MNYLFSDKNTLIWLIFAVYTVSALFILPNTINLNSSIASEDTNNARAISFASRFMMRIALIIPTILIIKNTI